MKDQKHMDTVGIFMNLMFLIVGLGVTAFVIWGGFQLLLLGIEKTERAECYEWADQAEEHSGFYLLAWQQEQCKQHNIYVKL